MRIDWTTMCQWMMNMDWMNGERTNEIFLPPPPLPPPLPPSPPPSPSSRSLGLCVLPLVAAARSAAGAVRPLLSDSPLVGSTFDPHMLKTLGQESSRYIRKTGYRQQQ